MKKISMFFLIALCTVSYSQIKISRNSLGLGISASYNVDTTNENDEFFSFQTPFVEHELCIDLGNNLFFDLKSSAGFSRNADQRVDYQSFNVRKLFGSFLYWHDFDIDRLYIETTPSLSLKTNSFQIGAAFPFSYDDETWYMDIDETTPEYPAGTGRTLNILTKMKFYHFRTFAAYTVLKGLTFKGYLETGLKKTITTDFQEADKKGAKQDVSYDGDTTEYTGYPITYGLKASFDKDVSDESAFSGQVMFETFEDDDNNYNNLLAASLGYSIKPFSTIRITTQAGIEYYFFEYDGVDFPDNDDPEDPELITTDGDDSFTLISIGTNLSYFPMEGLEIFLKADYGTYQNASYLPDDLKLGMGAVYTFDFVR
jgi:hypothetical protein